MLDTLAENLLDAVREDKDGALIELFEFYRPLVEKIKTTYHIRNFDDSDWEQEAMIVCYNSAKEYDEKRGGFGAFFKNRLNNHAISLLRRQKAQRRSCDDQALSLEALQERNSKMKERTAPLDYINYDLCKEFIGSLSDTERISFQVIIGDKDPESVKMNHDVNEDQIKRAQARTYKKLFDALLML